jgi:ribosome-binding ATPase YchF (GTP1/OBG family)
LADIATVTKRLDTLQKELKANPKVGAVVAQLQNIVEQLNQGKLISETVDELPEVLTDLQLLTAKNFIYVFNIDESELGDEAKKSELAKLVGPSPVLFARAFAKLRPKRAGAQYTNSNELRDTRVYELLH